mgnify:CR=1 FL=1
MAVVRNLMIRVGADFSAARKGLQGATRELTKFGRDTDRTVRTATGRSGLGRINVEFDKMRRSVSSSLSQLRGSKGVGGVVAALITAFTRGRERADAEVMNIRSELTGWLDDVDRPVVGVEADRQLLDGEPAHAYSSTTRGK